MARIPAGTTVPLVHKRQLTICEEPTGLPYIGVADGADAAGNAKVSGFDVDLLGLVATRLRVAPLYVRTEPRQYLDGTALKEKSCDLVRGLTTWSGFRKTFALTKPYGRYGFAILTKKGGPATLAALAGKRVGVIGEGGGDASTDAATYLKQYNAAHGDQIRVTPVNEALVAQVNAALADSAGSGQYAKAYQDWFGRRPTWLPH